MTLFRPPYLAEEIVLLPRYLYLGLLAGDDLVLGQIAGPRPAELVGEGLSCLRLAEPISGRLRLRIPCRWPAKGRRGRRISRVALPPFGFIDEDLQKEDACLTAFPATDFT